MAKEDELQLKKDETKKIDAQNRTALERQYDAEWIQATSQVGDKTTEYLKNLSQRKITVKKYGDAVDENDILDDKVIQTNVNIISNALEADSAKTKRKLILAPKTREKLKYNKARLNSQLLLDSTRKVAWWDSNEMTAVKDSVKELEDFLAAEHTWATEGDAVICPAVTKEDIESVEAKYLKAINACSKYLEVKTTRTGTGRYTLVRNKMFSLMEELSQFSSIKVRLNTETDLSWSKVKSYGDLLVASSIHNFVDKCVGEKRIEKDFEKKGLEEKKVNQNIDKASMDPGARMIVDLLVNDQAADFVFGQGEQAMDNANIAMYLLNLLTDMQSSAGAVYFHSGFAGYKGTETSRKHKDKNNKTKGGNTVFSLRHETNGEFSMVINGGQEIKLSGIQTVIEGIRGRLIKAENDLNELHNTAPDKYAENVGTKLSNQIMSALANDSYKDKQAPFNFKENVRNLIQNRFRGIDQSRFNVLKAEELRYLLKCTLEDPNCTQEFVENYLADKNGDSQWKKVEYKEAKTKIEDLKDGEEDKAALERIKKNALEYLTTVTYMPESMFEKKTPQELHKMAVDLINGQIKLNQLKKDIRAEKGGKYYVERTDDAGKYINTKEARRVMENWNKLDKTKTTVEFEEKEAEKEVKAEEAVWSENENKIKTFVSDLIFAKDNWAQDNEVEAQKGGAYFKEFIQRKESIDTIAIMLKDENLLTSTLERIPFITDAKKYSNQILSVFKDWLKDDANQIDVSKSEKEISDQITKILDSRKNKNLDEAGNDLLVNRTEKNLNMILDGFAESQIASIQPIIDEMLKSDFGKKAADEELASSKERGISQNERRIRIIKEKAWLNNCLRQNVTTGDAGQAKYLKQVLQHYFGNISSMDQRSVMAYMLREAKPSNMPGKATEKNADVLLKKSKESCLAGMFKGAGPLLQKTLQGIPSEGVPALLKYAMEDTRSRLLPISREYVKAQLNELVQNSNGKIEKIEVVKSLGAASIGEAFIVKVYGPEMTEGSEHVAKILRPDAANRMEREKAIFEKCAEDTSPAMEVTFKNTYQRIQEELNFENEASNVQKGKMHYDTTKAGSSKDDGVHSMNISNLTRSGSNVMLIEIAKGKTVDKDTSEIEEEIYSTLKGLYEFSDTKKLIGNTGASSGTPLQYRNIVEKITPLLAKTQKKQKHLVTLVKKWIVQSLYSGDGFYHGDLHAGNIMLDDDGATVIDYGNATSLSASQQKNMLLLFASAGAGFFASDLFVKGFEALLKDDKTDERFIEEFESKKDEFKSVVEKILNMGDEQDAPQKVAILVSEAQKMGFPLPSAVANYIQCQMRLQNTIDSYNKLITDMQDAVRNATESEYSPYNDFSVKHTANSFMAFAKDEQDAKKRRILIQRVYSKWYSDQMGMSNLLDKTSEEDQKTFDEIFLGEGMEEIEDKVKALRKAQASKADKATIDSLKDEIISAFEEEFEAAISEEELGKYNSDWADDSPFGRLLSNTLYLVLNQWNKVDRFTRKKLYEYGVQSVKEANDSKLTEAFDKLKDKMAEYNEVAANKPGVAWTEEQKQRQFELQNEIPDFYKNFLAELIRVEMKDVKNAKFVPIKEAKYSKDEPDSFVEASGAAIQDNKFATMGKLFLESSKLYAAGAKEMERLNS